MDLNAYDVIVCGGGSAGFAAAVTAAREGAKTLLVEQANCLGGTATAGLNFGFVQTIGMNGPVFRELFQRMSKLNGTRKEYFDPETYKYVSQSMAEEAGVNMLFHTFFESALVAEEQVIGIYIVNKGGRRLLKPKVVIDATGDADVAYSAGVKCKKGRDRDGRMQALTLRSRIGGVSMPSGIDWTHINRLLEKERKRGTVNIPSYVIGYLDAGGEGIHHERTFNLDMATETDATDPWQLSRAEIESRKRVWELLEFARKNVPGWENAYLIDTGTKIGIRETRRITGKYILSRDDVMQCRKFKNGIARCSFWIDMHDPEILQFPEGGLGGYIQKMKLPDGEWYEIPFACLIPENRKGLLVCGRCISSDREANGSLRIMPTCMNTGTAAGIAAAMALKENIDPSAVDGIRVRNRFIEIGGDI
ncbi:MAG: FAD-dependent oxidoreductase [Victivallaceae bacterium]|nr:FAD-dependent oxidoreductase [Victivallaceae bacterium]